MLARFFGSQQQQEQESRILGVRIAFKNGISSDKESQSKKMGSNGDHVSEFCNERYPNSAGK